MKTPVYPIQYLYTAGGRGVGVAVARVRTFQLLGRYQEQTVAYTFRRDGKALLVAEGEPRGFDSGHYAEEWRRIDQLLEPGGTPDDETIAEFLDFEYPCLLDRVRKVLEAGRSQTLSPRTERVVRVPERGEKNTDVTYAARLTRAYLDLRGTDEVGHRIHVHRERYHGYAGTIVYETRSWADEFVDWVGELGEAGAPVPDLDAMSSVEVGVIEYIPMRERR